MRDKIVTLLLSHGWEIEDEDEGGEGVILSHGRWEAHGYSSGVSFFSPTAMDGEIHHTCLMEWDYHIHSWQLLEWLAAEPNATPASQDAQHRES